MFGFEERCEKTRVVAAGVKPNTPPPSLIYNTDDAFRRVVRGAKVAVKMIDGYTESIGDNFSPFKIFSPSTLNQYATVGGVVGLAIGISVLVGGTGTASAFAAGMLAAAPWVLGGLAVAGAAYCVYRIGQSIHKMVTSKSESETDQAARELGGSGGDLVSIAVKRMIPKVLGSTPLLPKISKLLASQKSPVKAIPKSASPSLLPPVVAKAPPMPVVTSTVRPFLPQISSTNAQPVQLGTSSTYRDARLPSGDTFWLGGGYRNGGHTFTPPEIPLWRRVQPWMVGGLAPASEARLPAIRPPGEGRTASPLRLWASEGDGLESPDVPSPVSRDPGRVVQNNGLIIIPPGGRKEELDFLFELAAQMATKINEDQPVALGTIKRMLSQGGHVVANTTVGEQILSIGIEDKGPYAGEELKKIFDHLYRWYLKYHLHIRDHEISAKQFSFEKRDLFPGDKYAYQVLGTTDVFRYDPSASKSVQVWNREHANKLVADKRPHLDVPVQKMEEGERTFGQIQDHWKEKAGQTVKYDTLKALAERLGADLPNKGIRNGVATNNKRVSICSAELTRRILDALEERSNDSGKIPEGACSKYELFTSSGIDPTSKPANRLIAELIKKHPYDVTIAPHPKVKRKTVYLGEAIQEEFKRRFKKGRRSN